MTNKSLKFDSRAEFIEGFFYWWRGWGQLRRSRALGFYALIPLLLAVAFFISVFWITLKYVTLWTNDFVAQVLPPGHWWSHLMVYPLWSLFFALVFVSLVYFSYWVHVVLCGPFYSLLAVRALRDLDKSSLIHFAFSPRVLIAGILKVLLFCTLGIAVALFSFVPVINLLGLILALMILAFDTMDYTFDAMGLGLAERISYFFAHIPQWLGMSLSLALTLTIPGLTLLILPGAVVGAAMIVDSKGVTNGARATS